MPFQKGHKKIGGNVKGSKHKTTLFLDRIKELKIDLIGDAFKDLELVEDPKDRVDLRIRLMKFAYPEMKGDVNLTVTQNEATTNLSDEKLRYYARGSEE